MFASDVVIIFIVFIGVSFILFGKEKNVKKDSKFHKTIMNIVFTIAVVIVLCPWILMVLFYPIMYYITACYPILNNFYTLINQSHIDKLTM